MKVQKSCPRASPSRALFTLICEDFPCDRCAQSYARRSIAWKITSKAASSPASEVSLVNLLSIPVVRMRDGNVVVVRRLTYQCNPLEH